MKSAMCEKKVLCAKRKCYVRKENAMCEMKQLCAKRKCYVRNEIDELAVKVVHLNLYNIQIELAGKTQYHLLVSKLGKMDSGWLSYYEIVMWCNKVDYVGIKLIVLYSCCLFILFGLCLTCIYR